MPNTPNLTTSLSNWLTYLGSIHVSAIDMGLERVLPVAQKLGILDIDTPKKPYVFTVAGTNGKGSTTKAIAQICQASGYKTALYQSPHLVSFNERIQIDGQEADDKTLVHAFNHVNQVRIDCGLSLSFFEITTLVAFYIFAKSGCDVWVLEIGLGGRLDVVNIIEPDMCVITNVGIDHTDWLGSDREKIGFEKAGILRTGSTLIYGESDLPNSVKQIIKDKNVHCLQFGKQFAFKVQNDEFIYTSSALTLTLDKPHISPLNASIALSALLQSPLNINLSHIKQGLENTKLAGRFDKRLIDDRHWLFDVGHNEHGIQFLMQSFIPYWQAFKNQNPNAKLYTVFSMLADKDIDKVLTMISSFNLPIETWYISKLDNPRAIEVVELANKLSNHHYPIKSYATIDKAVLSVVTDSKDGDMILCFGSFHTIGESLIALGQAKDPRND